MANILDKIRLSGVTYDIVDSSAIHSLEGYATTNEVTSAITAASASILETVGEAGYQTSGDVQNAISGKADTSAVTEAIDAAVSGKADTTAVTEDIAEAVSGKADTSALTVFADAVKYDSNSKEMKFYNGGTGGTEVYNFDASPFIIDGMVQNVEIKDVAGSGTCLVVSFNTDAGKQDINIPLTEIFDASNYYTTAQTDSAIEAATSGKVDTTDFNTYSGNVETALSGKQDTLNAGTGIDITNNTISVTGVPLTVEDNVTSGSSNPVKSSGIYDFVTGETSTKQDTLVSGTNIKTVGTESILGSGNIKLMTAHVGTGNDATTLIFEFN